MQKNRIVSFMLKIQESHKYANRMTDFIAKIDYLAPRLLMPKRTLQIIFTMVFTI